MIIPEEIYELYNETVDDFNNINFGVNCRIFYVAKKVVCPNCYFNPITKTSSNKYKTGGPIQFSSGVCPYCNGVGFSITSTYDDIKARAYYTRKTWVKIPASINIENVAVQTFGFLSDLPKINNSEYIIIDTNISQNSNNKFKLMGQAIPYGLRDKRYCIAFWERL